MWLQRVRAQSINLQHANQKSMGCYFKLLFVIITIMYEGAHVGGGCGSCCHSPGWKSDHPVFWAVHQRGERREKSKFVLNSGSNSVCKGKFCHLLQWRQGFFPGNSPGNWDFRGSWELMPMMWSSGNGAAGTALLPGGSRSPQHQQHIPKSPQPAPTGILTIPASPVQFTTRTQHLCNNFPPVPYSSPCYYITK